MRENWLDFTLAFLTFMITAIAYGGLIYILAHFVNKYW